MLLESRKSKVVTYDFELANTGEVLWYINECEWSMQRTCAGNVDVRHKIAAGVKGK